MNVSGSESKSVSVLRDSCDFTAFISPLGLNKKAQSWTSWTCSGCWNRMQLTAPSAIEDFFCGLLWLLHSVCDAFPVLWQPWNVSECVTQSLISTEETCVTTGTLLKYSWTCCGICYTLTKWGAHPADRRSGHQNIKSRIVWVSLMISDAPKLHTPRLFGIHAFCYNPHAQVDESTWWLTEPTVGVTGVLQVPRLWARDHLRYLVFGIAHFFDRQQQRDCGCGAARHLEALQQILWAQKQSPDKTVLPISHHTLYLHIRLISC